MVLSLSVSGCIALSFFKDSSLWCIKYMLFVQAIQMQMGNFNMYKKGSNDNEDDGFTNYEGLNSISTVFSVIFSITNSLLIGFVFPE
jgi:hypothetical protein